MQTAPIKHIISGVDMVGEKKSSAEVTLESGSQLHIHTIRVNGLIFSVSIHAENA